ncbi:MAG: hypothetical protein ACKVOQ_23150 [Cyclobacteriaceae bacterium]
MKLLFFILFVCFSFVGHGQTRPNKQKIDSIAHHLDSLRIPHSKKADSLKNWSDHKLDSVNKLSQKANHLLDSLNPSQKLDRYTQRIDSTQGALQKRLGKMQSKLQTKVDSIKKLKLPTDKVEAQIKNLQGTMDSLQNSKPIKDVQKAEAKLQELQTKYSEKLTQIETKVNGKVEEVQTKLNSRLNELTNGHVAGTNIDKLKLPDTKLPQLTNGKIPSLPNPKMAGLPGASIPIKDIPGTGLPTANTPKASGNGLSIPGLQNPNLTIPGAEQLKDVQGKVGEVSKISSEANKYSEEIKNVKKGDLENTKELQTLAESQVNTKEMKKLKEQAAAIEKYKEQAAKYRDPEAMRKELEKQSKDIAFEKLASQQKKVDEAVSNLNKQKAKYGSIQSINDIHKRRYNPMRDKTFRERLLPGVSLQIQSGNNLLVDINPYIGYRITERWIAGIGWNERIASNFSKNQYFIGQDHVYGLRSYVQFKVGSKLTLRGEIEQINTYIKQISVQPLDQPRRDWVWSYFVGIKQDFKISKRINGNAQVLYNLYDPYRQSPYADRLNIRFGFEYLYKKRKRSDND